MVQAQFAIIASPKSLRVRTILVRDRWRATAAPNWTERREAIGRPWLWVASGILGLRDALWRLAWIRAFPLEIFPHRRNIRRSRDAKGSRCSARCRPSCGPQLAA